MVIGIWLVLHFRIPLAMGKLHQCWRGKIAALPTLILLSVTGNMKVATSVNLSRNPVKERGWAVRGDCCRTLKAHSKFKNHDLNFVKSHVLTKTYSNMYPF